MERDGDVVLTRAPAVAPSLAVRALASERAAPRFRLGPVLVVGAALGAVVNLLLGGDPYANMDSHAFEALARSLLAGHGLVYREPLLHGLPFYAFRSPGYSVFLALELWLGGVAAAVAIQGALQGVSCALLGDLAGRWAGPRAAWLAFALRFLWPAGWSYSGQLLTEVFFEFTSILTIWLVVRATDRRSLGLALAAGVAAGVTVLTRPVGGVACALATAAWLATRFPRGAAAFALVTVLVWLPWPLRNAARLHAFVPLLTSGGVASWNIHSNNPPIVAWTYMARHTDLGEVGLDRHFRAAALEIIRTDPAGFAVRLGRGVIDYLGPLLDRSRSAWLHRFAVVALLPALLWADWRRRLVLPGLVWFAAGLFTIPIAMHVRYRFPTEWCVIAAAAVGLEAAATRWGTRRATLAALGTLAVCIAFTLAVARG